MAKKNKVPRKGAICSILTQYIHPKQNNDDRAHRSRVVLIAKEDTIVKGKTKSRYTFYLEGSEDGPICSAAKSHFRVETEGSRRADFFEIPDESDSFQEPKIKWRKSVARAKLLDYIMCGQIPEDQEDTTTMSLDEVYYFDEEFCKYSYEKFAGRLKALRAKVKEVIRRVEQDLAAFKNYTANHQPSLYSHKGYIQWQGLSAQELLWDDLGSYRNNPETKPYDLWMSRPEYRDEFPLHAFRSKLEQEIRTEKYMRSLEQRGVEYRAS
jgi:hypothetical protein